ncbi:hypothetical protein GGS20DRAFT_578713 [Poronia punctata]|nr:hypothetical protein GGS20DRAFT_578713 [Poronia punctata]
MVTVFDMQSIPSLIGAGTAVAAAATGLVFGQLAEGEKNSPLSSQSSVRRKLVTAHDNSDPLASFSRPGTSFAVSSAPPLAEDQDQPVLPPYQQPAIPVNATSAQGRILRRTSHVQITPTRPRPVPTRRFLAKQTDSALSVPIEDSRDSISSGGSWIRRLSIRPMSQHGSLRSSLGPDSPSIFSLGSAAPILPASKSSPTQQLPPNKLVKRAPGTGVEAAGLTKRRGSRAQVTLRRPATSHQRSATLQHKLTTEDLPPLPKFSLEQQIRPRARTVGSQHQKQPAGAFRSERSRWKSFWHGRLSYSRTKASPLKGVDGPSPSRRIRLEQEQLYQVYLVTPNKVVMDGIHDTTHGSLTGNESPLRVDNNSSRRTSEDDGGDQVQMTPSKPPKQSASMQFSSPTSWISRTSSLRRRKRGNDVTGLKRNVSASFAEGTNTRPSSRHISDDGARKGAEVSQAEADLAAIFRPPETDHCSPPPVPPVLQLSSSRLDARRGGSSPSPSAQGLKKPISSPTTSLRVASHTSQTSHTRTLERASTVGSSEYHRGFTSGDDDDFNTDTPFDSFRTVGSGGKRVLDGSLESMFNDSPPNTTGIHTKAKRLSIQAILGPSFDGEQKITEEDESIPTPIRRTYDDFEADFRAASIEDEGRFFRGPALFEFPTDGHDCRLSLDDDDDVGWMRQDEMEVYNHLSPPGSMNLRRAGPNVRATLGVISGNVKPDVDFDTVSERPRSTVFDWAEPPMPDKREKNGFGHRPKTVHGKQQLDLRGGRSASRKGPVAAHVRSQSVPVVPDPADTAKSTSKFGTWGLGQKNVSEDWDNDFEFEEEDGDGCLAGSGGEKQENRFSMLVPASIQAAQPTVKAHSGQIRELSLLVNDLKRLCRLGREMSMLESSSAQLWHDAEGIIALASPDEDTDNDGTDETNDVDLGAFDERYVDSGFDGSSLDIPIPPRPKNLSPARRRSAFMPDDDIFGSWDHVDGVVGADRPKTPDNRALVPGSASVARSVMESMRMRRIMSDTEASDAVGVGRRSKGRLNFDTNSLKELVKQAGDLRDSLSELVRREDHITQSPVRTPKHTRADGSPAFTRVFDDPSTSPTRRLPTHPQQVLNNTTSSPSTKGISRRMQMMTVS